MENNWHDITYLKLGNEQQKNSYSVLNELKIFKMLREECDKRRFFVTQRRM